MKTGKEYLLYQMRNEPNQHEYDEKTVNALGELLDLYAQYYHGQQVNSVDLADVVGRGEQLVCRNCKYDKSETYHDKMWCMDCRQKDRFTAN